ncbi:MAG: DUF4058 family protein [Gemmataceae bacterium]
MPLHDWRKTKGWSGVHTSWQVELLRNLRGVLPEGYRAYIGQSPIVAIEDPAGVPDVSVRQAGPPAPAGVLESGEPDPFQPDREVGVNVALLETDRSIYVAAEGRLIAAVELVSVGNKDRDKEKAKYLARYLGYLTNGVHLLLVDVHERFRDFSFADEVAARLGIPDEPPLAVPHAISYRVHPDRPGGFSAIALHRHRLTVGEPIPPMPLSLRFPAAVWLDLEGTYMRAAADAYLA